MYDLQTDKILFDDTYFSAFLFSFCWTISEDLESFLLKNFVTFSIEGFLSDFEEKSSSLK